ncbi:hypothetical protein [Microbacterium sp. Leaf320]|uniref:hypothetical protein n=1 Tax=Microbacterium sp. Leaf320 TaxID=1736334 RepID=UPI0006FCB4E4|nr:hypothetical protein [Microbacterium sp. Leaf320]KQQ66107.1 hypothetical protein ASF63_12355 [Microbacterium sp. Leaf320]
MSDASELWDLAKDLGTAPAAAHKNIKPAVMRTSVDLKDDWQQGAAASGLANYSKSIDFDITESPDGIESEIGPNPSKRQGRHAFVEEANGKVRSAPQHAGRDALEANEDDFLRGLEIAIFDATAEAIEKS